MQSGSLRAVGAAMKAAPTGVVCSPRALQNRGPGRLLRDKKTRQARRACRGLPAAARACRGDWLPPMAQRLPPTGYRPTASRFCSRSSSWSRSAIRAMNSELVGFPLELETV